MLSAGYPIIRIQCAAKVNIRPSLMKSFFAI